MATISHYTPKSITLHPPIQSFETKIAWLYQRYKYQVSKNNPFQNTYYTLPTPILNHIFTTFNIIHSYFSSPVTCPTSIQKLYSPFSRDKIFGSLGTCFQYRWHGLGYAHPHDKNADQKSLYWARLAASTDPYNITIIALPNNKWYDNITSLIGPFPDTYVIAHFPPNTITYEEPTIPIHLNRKPYTETIALHLYCVHHKNSHIST